MSTTREWLEHLYGRSPGYFAVSAFAQNVNGKKGKSVITKWFATDDLDRAAKSILATSPRADVYVSVATHAQPGTPLSRGGESTVCALPGFWADLDIGEDGHKPAALPNPRDEAEALSILDGLPEPTLLMHSGGGLQAFWLFDEPWLIEDATTRKAVKDASVGWQQLLSERAQEKGLHLDVLPDLSRIWRVPGGQNHKLTLEGGPVRPVEARRLDGSRYSQVELASLGVPKEATRLSETGTAADDFPYTWAEILEPHGWHQCGRDDNGATRWARPGKTCGEGHSAHTDPYGVPVLVNFSASTGLATGPDQKLTKLKVWAHLNYNGDQKAARDALKKVRKSGPEEWAKIAERFVASKVDWQKLWTEVDPDPDWLLEPVITRGGQAVLYSEPKTGKTLVTQEWVTALALGREVLGNPARPPLSILYIDLENTPADIRRNAGDFGYEGLDIPSLHYYMFPSLAWLDTDEGGYQLHALAKYLRADLVVLDTLSRTIQGKENEPDTFNSFYNHTGMRLKADGIALLRLDHSGKDKSKGMRGASSKASDVDYVWELRKEHPNDEGCGITLFLERTHSRSPYGDRLLTLERRCEPVLYHKRLQTIEGIEAEINEDAAEWLADELGKV